jgi:precorrin-6Y C5,15-methyltransferase (decarboxylating)
MPARAEVLWDIGTASGSIAIEWMRAARDAVAVGFDPHTERLAMARQNAETLGTPRLALIEGRVPEAFDAIPAPTGTQIDLRQPHAIFIGGGLSPALAENCLSRLPAHGRLVANAVTLESEAVLGQLQAMHGGDLTRLSVEHAEPVGRLRGWRPAMTVTQWVFEK